LGWLLAVMLAHPISRLLFENSTHASAIALLGITLLFAALSAGQLALLQGTRRIGDVARANVISVAANTVISLAIFAWLRQRGIVPVLILSGAASLVTTWWLARQIQLAPASMSWKERLKETGAFVSLGFAFMWSALLASGVDIVTRMTVVRDFGLDAAGVYQAAWSLSGLFASFVLAAMGTDFYPRLTGAMAEDSNACRIVNEQTEIGLLLALPGLVATLAFSPLVIHVFYSAKFAASAALLPWFVLGVFGRVISWPMGFIMLAKGESRWFIATETAGSGLRAAMNLALVPAIGVVAAAYSFAVTYVLYTMLMLLVSRRLIGFSWSYSTARLILGAVIVILFSFAVHYSVQGTAGILAGGAITLAASLFSLYGLAARLESGRLIQWLSLLPGGRWFAEMAANSRERASRSPAAHSRLEA
jgi:PST family polysaccharide transporter